MNNEEIIFPVSYFSYTKMNDENLLIIDETILGYISAKRMSYQELLIFLRLNSYILRDRRVIRLIKILINNNNKISIFFY